MSRPRLYLFEGHHQVCHSGLDPTEHYCKWNCYKKLFLIEKISIAIGIVLIKLDTYYFITSHALL